MSKSFWAVLAIIVVVFGGIVFFKGDKAAAPNANGAKATSHIQGQGTSGVTLTEYGDYQCPYCGQYYPVVKQIQVKYNDQIFFQFRNLPLLQVHQNAFAAARAAEAASLQGKFWEMHDMLYENQSSWASSGSAQTVFNSYATSLGLNLTQFKKDYSSAKVNDVINADRNTFLKTGQQESTPTFFIDGKKISPSLDLSKTVDQNVTLFSKFIDDALAAKAKS